MKNQQYHYLCLIEELRKRLQNGQLHAGDVLPSEQEWQKLCLSKSGMCVRF